MLIEAGVEERAVYRGDDWAEFVRSLRKGDEAIVAELRIFGSRKALGAASAEIAGRSATLVTSAGTRVHHPTLEDVQRTESLWAKHKSMGGSKRAKLLNAKALLARRANRDASRMPKPEAEAIWRDTERYPLTRDALKAMPGWKSYMIAYRAFGAREPVE
jgi:hypothetical protein